MVFAEELARFIHSPIGFGQPGSQVNAGQAALRAVLAYGVAILVVRLGNRRSLGKASSVDVVLSIMLGSTLSRAINGGSTLLPSVAASAMLIFSHWVLAALTFRFHPFGAWVKGDESVLVRDGEFQRAAMRAEHMSEDDVREALRQQGKTEKPDGVAIARLERSGVVSVIKQKPPPKVLEVKVEAGVQTVRIEITSGGEG